MTGNVDGKVQAKLKKLLALAERGEGGERANAQRMLEKMLARHGLTLGDLSEEQRELRWFSAPNKHDKRLAAQIAAKVTDSLTPSLYSNKRRPKQVGVECTPSEAVEFELHFETLKRALEQHLDIAFSAFVQANRLFPQTDGEGPDEVTEEDLRIIAMAATVAPTPINPRLEDQRRG